KKNHPQAPSPKKETPHQASPQKEPSIESSPLPSNQSFDDWDNTMYDNDNNNLDNYSGHTDEGSKGGHIEEGHIDDKDSEGGYTKEEVYIEEEEEDIHKVSDKEPEAWRLPRGNQDAQDDPDYQDAPEDPEIDKEGEDIYGVSDREREAQRLPRGNQDAQDDSDYQDSIEDPEMDEELALPSQFRRTLPLDSAGIDDSVADRLVEQLYSFHGCTSDAHDACDDEYAQSPDSYTSISDLFCSQKPSGSIPDVLKLPGFMEQQQLNDPALLRQLFEGRGPPKEPQAKPEPPKKLHLPHKPPLEHPHRQPNVTYDIDSLCLFPTSLAVAHKGLFWQPVSHGTLNIATNIHFTLPADFYNAHKELKHGPRSLHQIVHTCLGVVSGFEDLRLYAFFPRMAHPNQRTTYLTDDLQSLWLDGLFLPTLYAKHK